MRIKLIRIHNDIKKARGVFDVNRQYFSFKLFTYFFCRCSCCYLTIYFNKNNLKQSLFHFREALKLDSSNSDIYNNLGLCLIEMKNYKDAIRILKYALFYKPNAPEIST